MSRLTDNNKNMKSYDMALATNPTDKEALFQKGIGFEKIGNYSEAIKYLD